MRPSILFTSMNSTILMAKQFPNAQNVRVFPASFMYMRGQIDSAEAFWKNLANDPQQAPVVAEMKALLKTVHPAPVQGGKVDKAFIEALGVKIE